MKFDLTIFSLSLLKDSRTNAKEFGGPSYQGAFDGFWWAFVTMSTVGQVLKSLRV